MDVGAVQADVRVKDETAIKYQKLFQDFLEEFQEDHIVKYLESAKELTNAERNTIEINFEDVERHNQSLASYIIEDYYRAYPFLCQALCNFAKDHGNLKTDKECFVSFVDVPTRHKVRELTTAKIGTLIRISGQVVRTHPVHPELISGTFVCLDCQTVIKDVEQQFKFTQPTICRNPVCANRRRFMLDVDKSHFIDFQKVRIQETQAELPRGCIPRCVEVILHAESVESVQAGDRYDFTGTLIVVPDVSVLSSPGQRADTKPRHKTGEQNSEGVRGLQALGVRELHYRLAFQACSIQPTNPRFGGHLDMMMEEVTAEKMKDQMTNVEWNKVYEMSRDRNLFTNLTTSLFPTIHGCDEVKRGLVLMLFGGVAKSTMEGTSLRGDINCCIVGDPSTGKSQFLKQIADFSPRAVYTSGKGSSAAGLTAAVVKDEESFDFVIEAGALMLADNGVCCIDEFDKMDPKDQVAIHEAMEQQTISIAKAGIRATLNARTSILAALNPINGRYDRAKSLQHNINLTAPIMSRFDLFFILVDECNEVVDYSIARKIIDLHSDIQDSIERIYTLEEILRYITFARQFKPVIREEAAALLVEQYGRLRQRDGTGNGKCTWRVTVRQLESMIRLSEAMAKMECSEDVHVKHVKEAYRLLNKSIIRVEQPDIHFEDDVDEPMELDAIPNGHAGEVNGHDVEVNGHGENGETNGLPSATDTGSGTQAQTQSEDQIQPEPLYKKKLTLTFEQYKTITNMVVFHMRSQEGIEEDGQEDNGIRRSEVVNWYLEQIVGEIESDAELIERKGLIEKVLDRLIYQDQVIIPLVTRTGLKDLKEESKDEDPMLVVHPNYAAD